MSPRVSRPIADYAQTIIIEGVATLADLCHRELSAPRGDDQAHR